MFLSSKHGFAFFHIPRTGGTSIEYSLVDITKYDNTNHIIINNFNVNKDLNVHIFNQIKHLNQSPIANILEKNNIEYSNWYEFIFVRNPYTRFLSIFEMHATYNQKSKTYNLDLDDYLKHLQFYKLTTPICKQQTYWLESPLTRKVNVHKFENLHNEWTVLCEKFNLGNITLKHSQKTNYVEKIELTPSQKDIIYEVYKDDFIEFGYDK